MMKKIIIAIIAIIVIGAGITAYLLIANPKNSNGQPLIGATSGSTTATANVTACDILTDSVAKAILGGAIVKPDGSVGDVSTSDINVSTCNYTTKVSDATTSTIPKASGVQILARIARTSAGAADNKQQFLSRPSNVQNVSGIGDTAFYNPSFRQLNVLKGGNWYIVTYYIDTITNASLSTDKLLAVKLQFK